MVNDGCCVGVGKKRLMLRMSVDNMDVLVRHDCSRLGKERSTSGEGCLERKKRRGAKVKKYPNAAEDVFILVDFQSHQPRVQSKPGPVQSTRDCVSTQFSRMMPSSNFMACLCVCTIQHATANGHPANRITTYGW